MVVSQLHFFSDFDEADDFPHVTEATLSFSPPQITHKRMVDPYCDTCRWLIGQGWADFRYPIKSKSMVSCQEFFRDPLYILL